MSVESPEGFKITATAAGLPRKRRRTRLPRPTTKVEATRVDPRIMQVAVRLAEGDVRRIQIVDRGESVIVWNLPIRGLGSSGSVPPRRSFDALMAEADEEPRS